jgi:hypothetical protein
VTDYQQTMIEALERALADARSGRLEAFAFAGTGHGDHALAFALETERPGERLKLLGALVKVSDLIVRAEK